MVKGKGAIETLLVAKMGHIQGAFYRKELGDIDLVWGNDKIGLQKIVEKHLKDFADFAGNNPYEKMSNAINEIIQNGKLLTENGVNTIWYKNGDDYYLVGISKGFNKKGDNNWVITSYKKTKGRIPDEIKGDTANLSAYSDEFNPLLTSKDEPLNSSDIIPQTPKEIIKQAKEAGKSVAETKKLLQQHKDIESKRKETQKLIIQEKKAKEKLHKEIGIFEKEKQNALEKLESIKTQINELEKKDLSSKQAQKQMDKLQTNLSFFANEIEKTRNLIKQRKDKLATTQEVYIPQNHTFSYDGREFNTREHFSILKQRSLNNQDDDFNGFDTLMREAIENALNIKPIKEFGTNYAEHYHSGETAIQKLISEAQAHKESGAKGEYKGQVAGAFHRKELGDIDLVWGQVEGKGKEAKGYGLAKIIEKHLNAGDFKAFGEGEAGLINAMSEIIDKGKVITQNGVDSIVLHKNGEEYRIGISKGWDNVGENKWIITSYKNNKYKESAETSYHDTFTPKEPLGNLDNNIIPQQTLESTMQKFNYDEKKAKDLLEWHKDSSPLTKDENGLPKVFYHYTNNGKVLEKTRDKDFEAFTRKTDLKEQYEKMRPYDKHYGRNQGSRYGIYFTENEKYAQNYATLGGQERDLKDALERGNAKKYEVFLNIKNPLDLDTIITKQNAKEIEQLFEIKNPPKHIKAININDYIGKDIFTYIHNLGFDEYGHKAAIAKTTLYRKDKLGVNGERDILNLADFLSLKGYDGLFFSRKETGREFIVFNPNQIKHIDNKGSYT
ncbi:putative barnase/colicin E5 family endoribonuclease, partial [Helicobacter bilis]